MCMEKLMLFRLTNPKATQNDIKLNQQTRLYNTRYKYALLYYMELQWLTYDIVEKKIKLI